MADSLVDQIFEQARLGSAQGQGIPGFAEGQRINLANRQLGVELAQLPLKMTLAQQQAQMNQLQIEQTLKDRSEALEAEKTISGLASEVTPLLKDGKAEEALNRIAAAGVSNNVLLTNPRYQNLQKQVDQMWQLKNQQQRYLALGYMALERLNQAAEKAKPLFVRLQDEALKYDESDPEYAQALRDQSMLEKRKVDLRQQQQKRLEETEARKERLTRSLDALSRKAMESELRQVENEGKLTLDERHEKTQAILAAYEAKAGKNTSPTLPPANAAGANAPAATTPNSFLIRVRNKNGQLGWMTRTAFDKLPPDSGFTLETTP